tara:strand:+ start:881 stop:1225 length:345 start_codon:yes stop_codon:yes gene_type:complete
LPTVILTEKAEIQKKNLAGVLITKDTPVEFPLRSAISMLGHPDFMFTFTKEDEKAILDLEEAKLKVAAFETKQAIKTHQDLVDLLIPKTVKKTRNTKPKSTKPKTTKAKTPKKE